MLTIKPPIQPTTTTSPTLQPATEIQTTKVIQPITDPVVAAQVQRDTLNAFRPSTTAEVSAKTAQLHALDNADSLNRQFSQAVQYTQVLTTELAREQSGLINPSVDANTQIQSLATDQNREKLLTAVRYGVDMWRLQARFQNITIMGQTAIGNPGCLDGPALSPWILQAPEIFNSTGYFRTLATAVAEGINENFQQWMNTVTVPGLPWYPMFAAFAGPFAPPIPNIPMPLIVCVTQNQNKLMSPSQIESAIKSKLPQEFLIAEMDLFYFPLSVNIANYFTSFLCGQNVMMVMGMGPVPTFNPPYVPVGPVVNGYVIPSPGHLAV